MIEELGPQLTVKLLLEDTERGGQTAVVLDDRIEVDRGDLMFTGETRGFSGIKAPATRRVSIRFYEGRGGNTEPFAVRYLKHALESTYRVLVETQEKSAPAMGRLMLTMRFCEVGRDRDELLGRLNGRGDSWSEEDEGEVRRRVPRPQGIASGAALVAGGGSGFIAFPTPTINPGAGGSAPLGTGGNIDIRSAWAPPAPAPAPRQLTSRVEALEIDLDDDDTEKP